MHYSSTNVVKNYTVKLVFAPKTSEPRRKYSERAKIVLKIASCWQAAASGRGKARVRAGKDGGDVRGIEIRDEEGGMAG